MEEQVRGFGERTTRINALDQTVDPFLAQLAARFDRLDRKISMQFRWLVGLEIAVLVAVIGVALR